MNLLKQIYTHRKQTTLKQLLNKSKEEVPDGQELTELVTPPFDIKRKDIMQPKETATHEDKFTIQN